MNDFIAIPMTIPIRKELSECLPMMKKMFFDLRSSLKPFGTLAAFKLLVTLPYVLPKFGVDFISNKTHILFTNLNASRIPYTFDGKKQVG